MSKTFLDPSGEDDGCIYRDSFDLKLRKATDADRTDFSTRDGPVDFIMSFDREYICTLSRAQLEQLSTEIRSLLD